MAEAEQSVRQSHFIDAPDGLKLHAVTYGAASAAALPVVCLPGLARTAEDFHELAVALASDATSPRRVIALDYRGRGRSEHDSDPSHYALPVEIADLLAVLAALAVGPAVFIGTSRGGILTMLLAALQPARIAGAVLNDIGPVIEVAGLRRIKGYVGKLPQPRDLAEGAEILQRLFGAQFPKFTQAAWLHAARLTWRESEGGLRLNYDPRLSQTLEGADLSEPIPTLWPQFDALAAVPVMAIRGLLSDILSAATVDGMCARHPRLELLEIADQGHAPVLSSAETIGRIAAFARACDRAANRPTLGEG
jgi:pimeloyl-ACP methyl ester carboxylesterase